MAEKVIDRFFRYVQIDTQSKEDSESFPVPKNRKIWQCFLQKSFRKWELRM